MGRSGRTATGLALAIVYLGASSTPPASAGDPGYVVVLQDSVRNAAAEIGDLQRRDGAAGLRPVPLPTVLSGIGEVP